MLVNLENVMIIVITILTMGKLSYNLQFRLD